MKSCAFTRHPGGSSPTGAVRFPQALLLAGVLTVAGCSHIGGDQVMSPVVVGMTEGTAPIYDDGENVIYEVHLPVTFPLRAPKANEMAKLIMDPLYPGPVWLDSKDFQIEIRYTLSNLTDKKQVVQMLIDPWNEFVKYKPGITVTEESAIPDRSGFDLAVKRGLRRAEDARAQGVEREEIGKRQDESEEKAGQDAEDEEEAPARHAS